MALKKCPDCGEMYSSSYRQCPFCEEEAAYLKPELRKKQGRRVKRQKAPSIFGPVMALVILLIVCAAVVYFFGDDIKGLFTKSETPVTQTQELTLSDTALSLAVGDAADLTVTGGDHCTWSSSDEAIATVSETGSITAVAPGIALFHQVDKAHRDVRRALGHLHRDGHRGTGSPDRPPACAGSRTDALGHADAAVGLWHAG